MQIIVAAFGRAIELTINLHGNTDDDTGEHVSLDGPRLEIDDDDQPSFGFVAPCREH